MPDFKPGGHHPDPFASEKPLFTINAQNAAQYANNLTEGHKALLRAYRDTYAMNVYPSHRTAAHPQRIYDATKRIATTANLAAGRQWRDRSGRRHPVPDPEAGRRGVLESRAALPRRCGANATSARRRSPRAATTRW